MQLQRGITFTIMPDGQNVRVPAMSRLEVRAESQSHEEAGGHDMVQALADILKGKKPVPGRARHNRIGVAHGNRVERHKGPVRGDPAGREGLRPAALPPAYHINPTGPIR
jgi:hypothetical protein